MPPSVCWCDHAVSLRSRTRVVILQHPREAKVAIGTVAIAARCLPDARVERGVRFDPAALQEILYGDPARPPVILFPTDDARDLRDEPFAHDVTLVLLDGTWSLAAKLLKHNEALRALPRVRFSPTRPSQYRIRKEPAEHCVASIEALAEALGALEGDPEKFSALLAPFAAMVDHQLRCAQTAAPRHRARPHGPAPRRPPAPTALDGVAPERAVLSYGEASAWPRGTDAPPGDELLHQVALRPHTGERFERFIAPSRPVASSFYHHADLPRDVLDAAVSRDEFARDWARFLGDDAALLTWGGYATDLLAAEGLPTPGRLDLRGELARRTHARPGALEDVPCDARLGAGRAGRRLAALARVYAALRGEVPLASLRRED
ncbi:MAG: tRNA-uridine aminocarboxypropyltransferase [Polyangiales bacterium]